MNRAILVGTIASEVRRVEVSGGSSVTKFRLKTVETLNIDGELRERSQTHLIDCWSPRLQKEITPFLREGQMVGVEGSIESRNVAKQGEPARWTTTIVIRGSGNHITVFGGPGTNMATRADAPESEPEVRVDHSRRPAPVPAMADDGLGDDVPF
jgi:single-stranded DNA-binding protein